MITIDITSGIELEYLAEGAANIVYAINPRPPSPTTAADTDFENYDYPVTEITALRMDPSLEGRLIRFRKAVASNDVLESYKHYEKTIIPLFPRAEDRVEHVLFHPTKALLSDLNQQLQAMESQQTRPEKRHGTYLAENEEYGLLVTDMSCSSPGNANYQCFEFKPKWLVQSPSAPADAVRCRTCALRHLRRSQSHSASTAEANGDFCPLGLVSKDKLVVATTAERITGLDPHTRPMSFQEDIMRRRLVDFIYNNSLLRSLRDLQSNLDSNGVLEGDDSDAFSTAMTLRDCTLFIKVRMLEVYVSDECADFQTVQVPASDKGDIEARLGDLDLKSPSNGKGEYWRRLEEQLIDEGWYTARETQEVKVDTLCLLAHGN